MEWCQANFAQNMQGWSSTGSLEENEAPHDGRERPLASRSRRWINNILVFPFFIDTNGHYNSCCQWYHDTPSQWSSASAMQLSSEATISLELAQPMPKPLIESLGSLVMLLQRAHLQKLPRCEAGHPATWLNLQSEKISMPFISLALQVILVVYQDTLHVG